MQVLYGGIRPKFYPLYRLR
ncbi:hypothetical protein CGLO_04343 [Colletotrichum gloeosporioides Cg-14]|uniref:Uncharacterized protein n=1 Tax=Colletotrichum gloeosporioides (strain Cg-14) TaxID=1237896 RepID=T0M4H5_COLGC|nr:hypothetical protein CGLO_04343 [Colletotrichum gloeosporioides Cg-14]